MPTQLVQKNEAVWETGLPLPLVNRGKVRDIYAVGKDKLLIVTTDRLSAFDVVLPTPISDKGRVLNQISVFWFRKLGKTTPNHIVTANVEEMDLGSKFLRQFKGVLEGRSVLVRRAKPLPVECVVRGYLAGSGWKDYQKTGNVCGHTLPLKLKQCGKLPEPVFTPSTKATVGHDMNIGFSETIQLVGNVLAEKIRSLSIRIYKEGAKFAEKKGIIIADTKFEFGTVDGKLVLIDEVLTPDSSRFWPKETYKPGKDQPSLDKQIVRNFLEESGWDKSPPGPSLPQEVAEKTSSAYRDVYSRVTGRTLY